MVGVAQESIIFIFLTFMIYLITNQTVLDLPDNIKLSNIESCINYISDENVKEIGLDIETTRKYNKYGEAEGLDPYLSNIVMLQVGDKTNQFIIDCRNTNPSEVLKALENKTIVGHNLKFEYKHLLVNYCFRLGKIYDTMTVEKIIYNGYDYSNGLKDLINRYFGEYVDKSTRLGFLNIGSRPFTISEIIYGAEDIRYPLLIKEAQEERIKKYNFDNVIRLEHKFTLALGEIEVNGIHLDSDKWTQVYIKNKEKLEEKEKVLNDFILNNFKESEFVDRQLSLFEEGLKCNIMWTSSSQVVKFFKFLNICPQAVSKTTKKLTYTVEAKEVQKLLLENDINDVIKAFIKDYLKFKELEQSVTTFGIKFLKHINPITNRVHSSYNQLVNTGRISSTKPNNQNIPSNKEFRNCFVSEEGYDMINADFSGQENIILVNKSLDKELLAFYDNGFGDMHSYVASLIFKEELKDIELNDVKKLRPDLRQLAKGAGFALAYGGDGYTLATNLGVSKELGEEIYLKYFKAFPGLKDYFDRTIKEAFRNGYILIDNISNRKYFLPTKQLYALEKKGDFKTLNKLKSSLSRKAMNYCIQGEAGSVTKLAAVYIYEECRKNNILDKVKTVLLVHDEIVLEAESELNEYARVMLQDLMEKAGKVWCKRIPLKAEAVIHKTWMH
jgi:DNA polymerase-1